MPSEERRKAERRATKSSIPFKERRKAERRAWAESSIPSLHFIQSSAQLEGLVSRSPNIDIAMAEERLNELALRPLFYTSKAYFIYVIALSSVIAWAGACWGYQIFTGMGVTDLKHPVFWGLYISTFVFWVGVSHSGTIVSSLLRLSKANWRRPILRAAECMTAFSLIVAGLFPMIHVGRLWRVYYMFPLPNQRELWPNYRSPLAWDMLAISVYLTGSLIFLYIGLLPDIALARDRCHCAWRRAYLKVLALGWRGTNREWHCYEITSTYLAVLILLIAPSVHTIVSWDFAMTITPGWHTTIFGPYFVVGAIYSGVAGVIMVMVLLRWIFPGLKEIILPMHLNNLSKLWLAIAIIWAYFYFCEYNTAWYAHHPAEWEIWKWQGTRFPCLLVWMLGGTALTIGMLAFEYVRTNPLILFILTFIVNIGMYMERYLIVVPVLSHRDNPFMWTDYFPSFIEISIAVGALAFFILLFFLFIKLFPIITIADIKEGNIITGDLKMGNTTIRIQARLDE